jgi:GNAT superfamily N-acetyltransferase
VDVRVRRASVRDIDTISKQAREAAREDGKNFGFTPDAIRSHAFGASPIVELMVAESAGAIVGHTVAYKGYDITVGQANLVLTSLYVAPEARRGGLARLLISAVSQRARETGCRRIHITTGITNEVAHRFYAAIGAKEEKNSAFVLAADAIEWLASERL